MSSSKQSANVFGTFLDNVSSTPSKPSVDWDSMTKQAIQWSKDQAPNEEGGAVSAVLRAIAEAGAAQSIATIVSSTNLGIDAVTNALFRAQSIGMVQQVATGGATKFELTAAGKDALASTAPR